MPLTPTVKPHIPGPRFVGARTALIAFSFWLLAFGASAQSFGYPAVFLSHQTWTDARKLLNDTTIVVIPLGASAKEHGPHLQLRNDHLIAEYLAKRIARTQRVVVYPTLNYHYYPAFLEYAGSTSLQLETATNLVTDIIRVISAHGPKKFYILNTGVSTLVPLKLAQEALAKQGILMTYTDILAVSGDAEKKVKQQTAGTHADEIETSVMLYIAPETVDMTKAAKDIPLKDGPGPLTLDPNNPNGRYSPTGIYGDATLANSDKGRIIVEAMVLGINNEINTLRKAAALPKPTPSPDLARMAGVYKLSATEKITVTLENGKLMMDGKAPRKVELVPVGDNVFSATTRGKLIFFKDEAGAFSTMYLYWEGKDFLGRK